MQWLSSKTQNACFALIELAKRHRNPSPVGLKTIAKEQQVSSQFLVQILSQLKRAGLVKSTRGSSGGYRLAIEPREISLLDILTAMEGETDPPIDGTETPTARVLFDVWLGLMEEQRQKLAGITLESLASRVESQSEDMYYI